MGGGGFELQWKDETPNQPPKPVKKAPKSEVAVHWVLKTQRNTSKEESEGRTREPDMTVNTAPDASQQSITHTWEMSQWAIVVVTTVDTLAVAVYL
jgi:hypothetical protein